MTEEGAARAKAERYLDLAGRSPVWVSVVGWAALDVADAIRDLAAATRDRPRIVYTRRGRR